MSKQRLAHPPFLRGPGTLLLPLYPLFLNHPLVPHRHHLQTDRLARNPLPFLPVLLSSWIASLLLPVKPPLRRILMCRSLTTLLPPHPRRPSKGRQSVLPILSIVPPFTACRSSRDQAAPPALHLATSRKQPNDPSPLPQKLAPISMDLPMPIRLLMRRMTLQVLQKAMSPLHPLLPPLSFARIPLLHFVFPLIPIATDALPFICHLQRSDTHGICPFRQCLLGPAPGASIPPLSHRPSGCPSDRRASMVDWEVLEWVEEVGD